MNKKAASGERGQTSSPAGTNTTDTNTDTNTAAASGGGRVLLQPIYSSSGGSSGGIVKATSAQGQQQQQPQEETNTGVSARMGGVTGSHGAGAEAARQHRQSVLSNAPIALPRKRKAAAAATTTTTGNIYSSNTVAPSPPYPTTTTNAAASSSTSAAVVTLPALVRNPHAAAAAMTGGKRAGGGGMMSTTTNTPKTTTTTPTTSSVSQLPKTINNNKNNTPLTAPGPPQATVGSGARRRSFTLPPAVTASSSSISKTTAAERLRRRQRMMRDTPDREGEEDPLCDRRGGVAAAGGASSSTSPLTSQYNASLGLSLGRALFGHLADADGTTVRTVVGGGGDGDAVGRLPPLMGAPGPSSALLASSGGAATHTRRRLGSFDDGRVGMFIGGVTSDPNIEEGSPRQDTGRRVKDEGVLVALATSSPRKGLALRSGRGDAQATVQTRGRLSVCRDVLKELQEEAEGRAQREREQYARLFTPDHDGDEDGDSASTASGDILDAFQLAKHHHEQQLVDGREAPFFRNARAWRMGPRSLVERQVHELRSNPAAWYAFTDDVRRHKRERHRASLALGDFMARNAKDTAATTPQRRRARMTTEHQQAEARALQAAAQREALDQERLLSIHDKRVRRQERINHRAAEWLAVVHAMRAGRVLAAALTAGRAAREYARRAKAVASIEHWWRTKHFGSMSPVRAFVVRARFLRRVLTRVRARVLRPVAVRRCHNLLSHITFYTRMLVAFRAFHTRVRRCQDLWRSRTALCVFRRELRISQWDEACRRRAADVVMHISRLEERKRSEEASAAQHRGGGGATPLPLASARGPGGGHQSSSTMHSTALLSARSNASAQMVVSGSRSISGATTPKGAHPQQQHSSSSSSLNITDTALSSARTELASIRALTPAVRDAALSQYLTEQKIKFRADHRTYDSHLQQIREVLKVAVPMPTSVTGAGEASHSGGGVAGVGGEGAGDGSTKSSRRRSSLAAPPTGQPPPNSSAATVVELSAFLSVSAGGFQSGGGGGGGGLHAKSSTKSGLSDDGSGAAIDMSAAGKALRAKREALAKLRLTMPPRPRWRIILTEEVVTALLRQAIRVAVSQAEFAADGSISD